MGQVNSLHLVPEFPMGAPFSQGSGDLVPLTSSSTHSSQSTSGPAPAYHSGEHQPSPLVSVEERGLLPLGGRRCCSTPLAAPGPIFSLKRICVICLITCLFLLHPCNLQHDIICLITCLFSVTLELWETKPVLLFISRMPAPSRAAHGRGSRVKE